MEEDMNQVWVILGLMQEYKEVKIQKSFSLSAGQH